MSNVTMQRLKSCARIGAAGVVTMVSMFGMTLDPTLVEIIAYVGVTLLAGGYVAWKDNNLTRGRIAAQDMVDVIRSDFGNVRKGPEDELIGIIEDAIEEILEEDEDDDTPTEEE